MASDYKEYEKACKTIRKDNAALLDEFFDWLHAKGLSDATINKHCSNTEIYVNHYLLYNDPIPPEDGTCEVGMFLGFWFIRKAMWASPASMKSIAASLKKFYQFMFERGSIDKDALDDLKDLIKEDMPEWQETLRRYDDPEIETSEEIWGF